MIGVIVFIVELLKKPKRRIEKQLYQYKKREFFMSRAEHDFYDKLIATIGKDYYVFAQVHLPTILDNKVVGQNWKGAFRHIDEKSVDFVLCDKNYISPKLVIELDDKSHEREDRVGRDIEVERILKEANMPLLRLKNSDNFSSTELIEKINLSLKK